MANKIAQIEELEYILTHRKSKDGVQIGHFWSVLQIYLCIKSLGISIKTLCDIASMLDDRIDSKYQKNSKPINPMMLRKHLHLKATPCQTSHTVVTKEVSKGIDDDTRESIKKILTKFNSYGPEIEEDLCSAIESGKGRLVSTKATTMGSSDFISVLQVALVLLDMARHGYLEDISDRPNNQHKDFIIKKIKEYQKSNDPTETVGLTL